MIKLDQFKMQIEMLSSEQLRMYFKTAKIFLDLTFLEERVRKLSTMASFITIRNNENIIALVGFYMNKKPLCYITHVSILDLYRRQGLATKMLVFLEEQAEIKEFSVIRLEVAKRNFPAIELYKKLGYVIVSDNTRENYYMEKQLSFI